MHGGVRAEKQRIRQEAKIISEGLTPEYRREASREITRQVLALPEWKKAATVMAYWSLPTEPDTQELMETALREGKTLLLPRKSPQPAKKRTGTRLKSAPNPHRKRFCPNRKQRTKSWTFPGAPSCGERTRKRNRKQ